MKLHAIYILYLLCVIFADRCRCRHSYLCIVPDLFLWRTTWTLFKIPMKVVPHSMLQVDWTDDHCQPHLFLRPFKGSKVGYFNSYLLLETQRSSGMIIEPEVQSYQLKWQVGYGLQGQGNTPNHDNRSRNSYGYPWHGKTRWLDKTLWGTYTSNRWRPIDCARYTVP